MAELKIKSMREVFNQLVEWILAKTDKITDFNVGSAARTLTEAIAIQFEEFYFRMKQNVLYAIENSVYDSFGFELKLAQSATGYITINFAEALSSAITFDEGTIFCTNAVYGYIYFASTEEIYAEEGSMSVMIPVKCTTSGVIGNVPAKSIDTIIVSNNIIEDVYNEAAFTNGVNEETSTERKKRFQNYIRTLARGTSDAILYGTLEVEGVSGAWIDDNYIGYVKVYAHNSDGELPAELRSAVLKNLENYRAGGIEVEVLPIVKKPMDLSLRVMISNEYDTDTYNTLISGLVERNLNEYSVSTNLYMSDIIHMIKSAFEDVVINITILVGEDTIVGENELVRPGQITVTCVNMKDWRS